MEDAKTRDERLNAKYLAEGWGIIAYAALGIAPIQMESQAREVARWSYSMAQASSAGNNIGVFQWATSVWLVECFGCDIAEDKAERSHRFLEESLELVQSLGCTKSEAHQLVDYVFNRPKGDPTQEVGGTMVTLAALCYANDMNMDAAAMRELARCFNNKEKIRAKQAAKPKHSPLPQ